METTFIPVREVISKNFSRNMPYIKNFMLWTLFSVFCLENAVPIIYSFQLLCLKERGYTVFQCNLYVTYYKAIVSEYIEENPHGC